MTLVLLGFVPLFLVLQFGPQLLARWLEPTWRVLVAAAVMLALALAFERRFFKRGPREALEALGFRTSTRGALAASVVLTLGMLAFFPAFAVLTGAQVRVRGDWWWVLVAIVAFNGIGEEALFRGFTFGGLRRAGLSFARAAPISLLAFAAAHLFLFFQNTVIVATLGTLVAVAWAVPVALLFERAGDSIWPPVVLHAASHAIRLVDVSEPHTSTVLIAWLALQLFAPFLIFGFRRNWLAQVSYT
jgi:membrane protease YdiL (CAAX protease family)